VLGLSAVTVQAVEREIQREDEARDAQLNVFDREFYTFNETTDKLLRFVVEQQAKIDVPRTEDYPRMPTRTPPTPKDTLLRSLTVRALAEKDQWRPGLDEARVAALQMTKDVIGPLRQRWLFPSGRSTLVLCVFPQRMH
jgi:hypothetical protein